MYGISVSNLIGVIGPKGLPPYVTKRLESAFTHATKEPSFIDLMKKMDTAIAYMTGEEMGKYIEKTYKEHEILIKQTESRRVQNKLTLEGEVFAKNFSSLNFRHF